MARPTTRAVAIRLGAGEGSVMGCPPESISAKRERQADLSELLPPRYNRTARPQSPDIPRSRSRRVAFMLPRPPADLAATLAPAIFRTNLEQPGFAHLDLGPAGTPAAFRAVLIALGQALARLYQ